MKSPKLFIGGFIFFKKLLAKWKFESIGKDFLLLQGKNRRNTYKCISSIFDDGVRNNIGKTG